MTHRIIFLAAFSLLTACGPATQTPISELSNEERTFICEEYTWPDTTCSDGREIEGISSGECIDYLEDKSGSDNCLVTAGDLQDISRDPCSDDARRALYLLSSCFELDDLWGQ